MTGIARRIACAVVVIALAVILRAVNAADGGANEFAVGADLSSMAQAERNGPVFKDNGQTKPGLALFKDHGYNWVRLRLFHTPTRLPNSLEYTIALAKDAKQLGYKFLLDFHYSDTWADPQKQFIPLAWSKMSHEELVEAVYAYSRDSVAAFRDAGAMPDMVQVGNEIIGGMLWPDGKLPGNWSNFAELVKAGIGGVHAGAEPPHPGKGETRQPRIMIHIDRGGDKNKTKWFFDHCKEYGIEFDVIGQSYYPWWHGSLTDLEDNLAFMAKEYDKDIMLVEVAYNWRPAEYRSKPGPFSETPEGQKEFLESVKRIVLQTPGGHGKGIFWWEPAVGRGGVASRGMFDDEKNALPVIRVFDAAGSDAADSDAADSAKHQEVTAAASADHPDASADK